MSGQRFGRPGAPYNPNWAPSNYNAPPPNGPYGPPPPPYRNAPPNYSVPGFGGAPHPPHPGAVGQGGNSASHSGMSMPSGPPGAPAPSGALAPPGSVPGISNAAPPSQPVAPGSAGGPPFNNVQPPPNTMQVAAAAMFQAMFMQTAAMMTAATQNYSAVPPFPNFSAPPPVPFGGQPPAPFTAPPNSYPQPPPAAPPAPLAYAPPSNYPADPYALPGPSQPPQPTTPFSTPTSTPTHPQRTNYPQTPPNDAFAPSNASQSAQQSDNKPPVNHNAIADTNGSGPANSTAPTTAAANATATNCPKASESAQFAATDRKRSWQRQSDTPFDSNQKRARVEERSSSSYSRNYSDANNRSYYRHGNPPTSNNAGSRFERSRTERRNDDTPAPSQTSAAPAPRRFHHVDEAQLVHSTKSVFNLKEFSTAEWVRTSPAEPFFVRASYFALCNRSLTRVPFVPASSTPGDQPNSETQHCMLATSRMVELEDRFEHKILRRRDRSLRALPSAVREQLERYETEKAKLYQESTRMPDEDEPVESSHVSRPDPNTGALPEEGEVGAECDRDSDSPSASCDAESSDSLELTDSDSESDEPSNRRGTQKWTRQNKRTYSDSDADADTDAPESSRRERRTASDDSDSSASSVSIASDSESDEPTQSESDEELVALKRKLGELRKQKRRWDRKLRRIRKSDAGNNASTNAGTKSNNARSRRSERARPDDTEDEQKTARNHERTRDREHDHKRKGTEKKRKRTAHTTMVERMRRMEAKVRHPLRLHPELWFNESHEMNDGPACNCSSKNRIGPMHDLFAGEKEVPACVAESNNADRLYHYRMTITPCTNMVCRFRTTIEHDEHTFAFEGFSILSHYRLVNIPPCNMIRYNIPYTLSFEEENFPENFTVRSLDLFSDFLFNEILELVDLTWRANTVSSGCRLFHVMPRFCRDLPAGGKELLSMDVVLEHFLKSATPLIPEGDLTRIIAMSNSEWQQYIEDLRGAIVINPIKKPQAIRVDQLDRPTSTAAVGKAETDSDSRSTPNAKTHIDSDKFDATSEKRTEAKADIRYPIFVHFTLRPLKLSIYREPAYQRLFKQFTKLNYLLKNKAKVNEKDRQHLESLRKRLEEFHTVKVRKREIAVEFECDGFVRSGLKSDLCQHALMLPVLLQHLRFQKSLDSLEVHIGYEFKDRSVLQQALTHPSFPKMNFGTNSDHAQNAITNCGVRNVEYGDKIRLFKEWRKRGLTTLIRIMSYMPTEHEARSEIYGNDRLEFLGDAVLEFIVSVHLYFMFPSMKEGWLAAYRQALVQNHHLAELAVKLGLHRYHLYVHGSDFCMMSALRHARSDVFEAFIAALYLDANIELPDRIFSKLLLGDEPPLYAVWVDLPVHPLQAQEPSGDRHWLERSEVLRKMSRFEESIGIQFKHIRLLARAFTMRSSGFNALTLGDNQRLEFLGDTVLKLVTSDYLIKHFPKHHEGHLSLLRSALVNRATEAIVCDELGMCEYITGAGQPIELLIEKRKADLLEAFIGALYVDQDLCIVEHFCRVCFFPRLAEFIMTQEWNDPKSKLQQCCLTLRKLNQIDPDVPVYKVIDTRGPTNARTYMIGVYFRGRKLAIGKGHSIKEGEMSAATLALRQNRDLFMQLQFQNRLILKKYGYGQGYEIQDEKSASTSSKSTARDESRPRKTSAAYDETDGPISIDKTVSDGKSQPAAAARRSKVDADDFDAGPPPDAADGNSQKLVNAQSTSPIGRDRFEGS